MTEPDVDDLGQDGGRWFPSDGGPAHQLTRRWPIDAIGNRSRDWAVRDLIVGGALRDPRNGTLRKLSKNGHPKFFNDTYGMDELSRKQAARCRAFLFFHYLSLIRLSSISDRTALKRLNELKACCPNLFLVDESKMPSHRLRPCRHAQQCPFCLARAVVDLHHDLSARPFSRPGTFFALVSVEVDRDHLITDQENASTNKIPRLKKMLNRYLRSVANHLDASGGLTTFQIGPKKQDVRAFQGTELKSEAQFGFTARATMVIELSADQAVARLSNDSGELVFDDVTTFDETSTPRWVVRAHTDNHDALRDLLFGTSPRDGESGVTGAFAYKQWHLASEPQWQEHFVATKGLNLFSLFGDWRANNSQRRERRGFSNANSRRGGHRQRDALRRANALRNQTATREAELLAQKIGPIEHSLRAMTGRPLGRTALAEACEDEGIQISQRQLRRVLPIIRAQQLDEHNDC